MIIINYNSLQCSDCCHFSRFDYDAKTYAADADTENSDCFNEKKQIYYTVDNDNNFKESESEKNNLTINFTLSESPQHRHEC